METKPASELRISDIGKTFRSITYPNNNKTAKPNRYARRDENGHIQWNAREVEWTLTTLYAHENGNIKINNHFHLHADTELEEVDV